MDANWDALVQCGLPTMVVSQNDVHWCRLASAASKTEKQLDSAWITPRLPYMSMPSVRPQHAEGAVGLGVLNGVEGWLSL